MICKFCKEFRKDHEEMRKHVWIKHVEELYELYNNQDVKDHNQLQGRNI